MNNPKSIPPNAPIDPLVMAVRLDAVADSLNQADILIQLGKPLIGRDVILAAGGPLRELGLAGESRGAAISAVVDVMASAIALIEEGNLPAAQERIQSARTTLADLAREYRQESDRAHWAAKGVTLAEVERPPSGRVLDDCFRNHTHASQTPAAPRGWEAHAQREAAARKASRSLRRQSFLRSLPRRAVRLLALVVVVVAAVKVAPHAEAWLAPVVTLLAEHGVSL